MQSRGEDGRTEALVHNDTGMFGSVPATRHWSVVKHHTYTCTNCFSGSFLGTVEPRYIEHAYFEIPVRSKSVFGPGQTPL